MGALLDGFNRARKEHDDRVAERRRKEALVDERLAAVGALLDADAAFLEEHDIGHETAGRVMHVIRHRSPILAIHYEPAENAYRMTYMRDNTSAQAATADDCAAAVGALLFSLMTRE